MNNIAFRIIIRRFLELFVTNFIVSVALTVLNIEKILSLRGALTFGAVFGIALFLVANVKMQRDCYFDLRDKKLYYFTNISAYIAFALFGFAVYFIGGGTIYTWLFSVTKFAKFFSRGISVPVSAAMFHCIGLAAVLVSPLGMDKTFAEDGWVADEV